jgi:hypothetical protein
MENFILHQRLRGFALSVLSYRKNFEEYIPIIAPGCTFHFDRHKNGAYYHGVVIDEKTGTIEPVFRGTDGDNVLGQAQAWFTNARIFTGPDGIINGCQEVVEGFLNKYGGYFKNMKTSHSKGHSQGSMCAKILALFVAEQFKNIDLSTFETYADFPAGDKRFENRCMIQHEAGRLHGNFTNLRGDPAGSPKLRNENNPLLDGVDSGTKMMVADVLGPHADSALGLFAHSPRAYCFAKMWDEVKKIELGLPVDNHYLQSISWILWRLKN